MAYPVRVLFLCTHNSARSQMAEGLLRWLGKDDFAPFSAGTEPGQLHPLAVAVMQDINVDISGKRSKHLNEYLDQEFDYVITVCDRAKETCPTFPGDPVRIHWSFDDPAVVEGNEETRREFFRKIRSQIGDRLRLWVLNQRKLLRERGYQVSS
jgi:arsenate reductase (thioredoxin)